MRMRLDAASLPSPAEYLASWKLIAKPSGGSSAAIRCPLHKAGGERNPSMVVNLLDGHFKCFACGAKGGDIVALHRLITGLPFRAAVRDLGGVLP